MQLAPYGTVCYAGREWLSIRWGMVNNAGMTKDMRATRSRRLTAADWIDAACLAIAEGGVGAVAVEPLAQRLEVTKGSFYWHFPNRDALLKAALERWEEVETEEVIATVAKIDDPRERLKQLIAAGISYVPSRGPAGPGFVFGPTFDLAIADAANDPIVEPILQRVSERRFDYLEQCYLALGSPPARARHQALLALAVYVGTLRLAKEAPSRLPGDQEFAAYQQHVIATIMPEVESSSLGREQPPPSAPHN